MKFEMNQTRNVLLLAGLAFPALGQDSGPSVQQQADTANLKLPSNVYTALRGAIEKRQSEGIVGVETFDGSRQLVVGAYPRKYEIRERAALADDAYDAAGQIASKSQSNLTRWVNVPAQNSFDARKLNLSLLELSKKEILLVVDDSVARAVALGLIKLEGTSAVSVDAPVSSSSPFDTIPDTGVNLARAEQANANGAFTTPRSGKEWFVEVVTTFKDESMVSRPEIATGELAGRSYVVGRNGADGASGLIELKGEVTKSTNRWNPDYKTDKERLTRWRDSEKREYERQHKELKELESRLSPAEVRRQGKVLIEECSRHNTNWIRAHQALERLQEVIRNPSSTSVSARIFLGPVGSKAPQNSEELLAACQKLIETEYREQCRKTLLEILGDGKKFFGASPDHALNRLAEERMRLDRGVKTAPLRNLNEVKEYISDCAFGLTDEAVPDLRRLAQDMVSRCKGETEREMWRTVISELHRVVPLVQELRKSNPDLPETRRINWSRFNVSLPLETVIPGMLYERLRID